MKKRLTRPGIRDTPEQFAQFLTQELARGETVIETVIETVKVSAK